MTRKTEAILLVHEGNIKWLAESLMNEARSMKPGDSASMPITKATDDKGVPVYVLDIEMIFANKK